MTSNGEHLDLSLPNREISIDKSVSRDIRSKGFSGVRQNERSPERSRRRGRSRDGRDRHHHRLRDRSKDRPHERQRNLSNRYHKHRDSRGSQRRDSRSRSPSRRKHQDSNLLKRKETPPPSKVLGVFGLSLHTRERDLEELFDEFGKHESVTIVYDHRTDRSRGFGFVSFEYEEDAVRAKEKTNGLLIPLSYQELHGRRIRVDFSMTQKPHSPTPGQYMGRQTERPPGQHYQPRSWSRSRSRGRSHSR
ncbi:RNA-binding domain-containing protein [Basidiobolus meristosporus CBS 931.73]|uniref:RNA-binding domain-containing protein n=1 Tax=Basidiobolus meristosporus CBS 931.73 TaxID=1314790 RepID=A0A1Y1XRH6_9FUNG|nr:RNA-binding domain-containing protein [Basidiobolus meristosporus CBS 931.73]|eukprot:ORX88358.1 RNA-binding domain-containing protein [Basidiobolus meristosporus CBS 931.73]